MVNGHTYVSRRGGWDWIPRDKVIEAVERWQFYMQEGTTRVKGKFIVGGPALRAHLRNGIPWRNHEDLKKNHILAGLLMGMNHSWTKEGFGARMCYMTSSLLQWVLGEWWCVIISGPPPLCAPMVWILWYRMPLKSYTSKHISGARDVQASVCIVWVLEALR